MIHYVTSNGIGNAWVANELRIVSENGVPFVLHTLARPEKLMHASQWAEQINKETRALYPLPKAETAMAVLTAPFFSKGRFFGALFNALFGQREHSRARIAGIAHLMVACLWAKRLIKSGEKVSHIHSQWVNSCGTIAMYGSWLLDVPFSFTGHAADLFRERCALRDKIQRADFIVCISEFHRGFFLEHGARPEQLHIVYCGIDLEWFYPPSKPKPAGEGFRIVTSGRLVEKKGFVDLIEACRILSERGERFECIIGGSGPLEDDLWERVKQTGVEDKVQLTGKALLQEKIVDFMHGGDVYVLPCVWASDNDVDGLPQMLMEAMCCGLPAISTRLVGIPDLIIDNKTGLLVEPNSPLELADAISRLMHDPELAARLTEAGRKHVHETFNLENSLDPLIALYRERLTRGRGEAPSESAASVAVPVTSLSSTGHKTT